VWDTLERMTESVRVRPEILDEMLAHARREPHIECCGLLAGRNGVITAIFPATNALASATAYEIAPRELFDLFRTLRDTGLMHLGQYHSHLSSDNVPSATDIEQAGYPEQAYFIVALRPDASNPIRAFSIRDDSIRELRITLSESQK
jgi:[CysO sulfur-carrier protein]-S-L-cysteine hydrolase